MRTAFTLSLAVSLVACSNHSPTSSPIGSESTPAGIQATSRSENNRPPNVSTSVEGMTLTINASAPVMIRSLALHQVSGSVDSITLQDPTAGNTVAGPVTTEQGFVFHDAINLPAGETKLRLHITAGRENVIFTSNPRFDWVVKDMRGRNVRLSDTEHWFVLEASVGIVADPATVTASTPCSTLKWASQGVEHCYAVGNWSGEKSLSGSEEVCPNITSIYKIVCFTSEGSSVVDEVIVGPKG
ncbi:MAG: hypothetical protein AAB590_00465 [Patescibacteria group bacterium]